MYARRAHEKSQHAEDFGCIKINLFLQHALAVTQYRVTEACDGRIKNLKVFEHACVTSQTRVASATGAQQKFKARLTNAWDTLLKQYLIKSERTCSVHWRA